LEQKDGLVEIQNLSWAECRADSVDLGYLVASNQGSHDLALHQVVNSCAKQISLNTRVRPINYRKKVQARIKNVEWPLTATAADHHNLVCDQCVYSSCNRSTKHKIEIAVPANLVVYDCVEVLAYKRVQSDINER
jgi:hypothetical protein